MATPARGKKRLVVDVDLELDSEVEVASAFSRLSVSVVAKRTGESSTGDGCGFEHSTGKQRTSSKEWTSGNELTCAATSELTAGVNHCSAPRSVSVRVELSSIICSTMFKSNSNFCGFADYPI
ncbi:uncharacterized protein [Zea mays]|uniref:uncharacterized protein n=1 Tax=Zea mays TaxID=4577 RepID=UPI00165224FD|nr:uncharacterized protein LOC103654544 [Zea mays]